MEDYYEKVGEYYDQDAAAFEERYWANETLQRTRMHFRAEVKKESYNRVLEIGIGPGLDLAHFAQWNRASQVYGFDVSAEMVRLSREKAQEKGLTNVQVEQGSVEDLDSMFPGVTFDCIYVFFGGLNTVENLDECVELLSSKLEKGGRFVFTSINRYYLMGMFLDLIRLKPRSAFGRLTNTWSGYSVDRQLPSTAYSPSRIAKACRGLELENREGFSILHPAWFHDPWRKRLGRFAKVLWRLDRQLNHSPFWKFGELSLYTFRKK